MSQITGHIGKDHYKTEIKSTSNSIIADEPLSNGGQDLGFSPHDLLASSLAACTCITVRMYADRKEWELREIFVNVSVEKVEGKTKITRAIELKGELDTTQTERLMAIANKCPIHQILSNPIEIETFSVL
ncbi:MAG: OsmC family protein [Bacteroidetes bacterium]|nr:OsmC family protein [Bacteroidota bacterium]MBS1541965.1 OsmC family protein [Bacteroidota bacterium]